MLLISLWWSLIQKTLQKAKRIFWKWRQLTFKEPKMKPVKYANHIEMRQLNMSHLIWILPSSLWILNIIIWLGWNFILNFANINFVICFIKDLIASLLQIFSSIVCTDFFPLKRRTSFYYHWWGEITENISHLHSVLLVFVLLTVF